MALLASAGRDAAVFEFQWSVWGVGVGQPGALSHWTKHWGVPQCHTTAKYSGDIA